MTLAVRQQSGRPPLLASLGMRLYARVCVSRVLFAVLAFSLITFAKLPLLVVLFGLVPLSIAVAGIENTRAR